MSYSKAHPFQFSKCTVVEHLDAVIYFLNYILPDSINSVHKLDISLNLCII